MWLQKFKHLKTSITKLCVAATEQSKLVFLWLKSNSKHVLISNKIVLSFMLIVFLIFIGLAMPLLPVDTVEITNNVYYSTAELSPLLEIQHENTSSLLNIFSSYRKLEKLQFVESVRVSYSLLGKLSFEIKENYPIAKIKFMDTNFYIDTYGRVISSSVEEEFNVPQILNMSVSSISKKSSQVIPTTEMSLINTICNSLIKVDFISHVSSIDVSDIKNVRLVVSKLQVLLGTIDSTEEKIQWLSKISQNHSSGYLDLTHVPQGISTIYP